MNDALDLLLVAGAGGALGAVFFGGLWWTIRRGVSSPRPVLWFLGSLIVRMTIVLVGFPLVAGGHWERLLVCLLGFILARLVVTSLTRMSGKNQLRSTEEAGYAP